MMMWACMAGLPTQVSRRNRDRTTAEKDTFPGQRRALYYEQPKRRRHSDRRVSQSLRPSSPTISHSARSSRNVGGMDNQDQTSLILKLLEKTLDRLEPRQTALRDPTSTHRGESLSGRCNIISNPTEGQPDQLPAMAHRTPKFGFDKHEENI